MLLSGHTDVVPVAGQDWSSDPFRLRVEDGRAYGRGAVDMKGFDALVLALVPEMLAAGLSTPIHILLSYDEETTCLGSLDIIRRFGADLPRPLAVIVGEPTGMEVADAHKSIVTFHTTVHGHEAHSSKPALGASAVMAAAELICELNRIADDMMARGDPTGRFDPPYTTVHVGTVAGGTARNILAKLCRFHWEFRGVPASTRTRSRSGSTASRTRWRGRASTGTGLSGASRTSWRSRCRASRPIRARRPSGWPCGSPGATARSPSLRHGGRAVPGGGHPDGGLRARARWTRPTSRTSSSRWTSSRPARRSCAGSWRIALHDGRSQAPGRCGGAADSRAGLPCASLVAGTAPNGISPARRPDGSGPFRKRHEPPHSRACPPARPPSRSSWLSSP